MTDFDPTSDEFGAAYLDPDDELVSAYVDDEATPDERARVEASPELMARVDDYRSLSAEIGDGVPPLTDTARDEMVTNALAEWADQRLEAAGIEGPIDDDEAVGSPALAATGPADSPPSARLASGAGDDRPAATADRTPSAAPTTDRAAPVADLAAARKRRQRMQSVLGAVAAAVLLMVAVPLIANLDFGGDDASSSSDVAAEAAGDSADAGSDDDGDAGGDAAMEEQSASEAETDSADTQMVEKLEEASAAMDDEDDAADDAMADDTADAAGGTIDSEDGDSDESSPATTSVAEPSTTTQRATDASGAATTTSGGPAVDLGEVGDVGMALELATDIVRQRTDGTTPAPSAEFVSLEEMNDFLSVCGLELGEPELVATASLADGTRLYLVNLADFDADLAPELTAFDERCTVVDPTP